jgi:hypothetical protein
MSKVMFDSELVQALSVLAQHAIEGMRKPPRIAEDSQWSPEELEAMTNQKSEPTVFTTIPSLVPFISSVEQRMAVIRSAETEDLQAELFRRDAIIPAPREVKFGPVSDVECEAAYKAWLVFVGNASKSMRPALEEFARSRGVL